MAVKFLQAVMHALNLRFSALCYHLPLTPNLLCNLGTSDHSVQIIWRNEGWARGQQPKEQETTYKQAAPWSDAGHTEATLETLGKIEVPGLPTVVGNGAQAIFVSKEWPFKLNCLQLSKLETTGSHSSRKNFWWATIKEIWLAAFASLLLDNGDELPECQTLLVFLLPH